MALRWKNSSLKPLLIAVLAALLIHAEFLFSDLLPSLYRLFPQENPQPKKVSLVAVSPKEWEANRLIRPTGLQGSLADRDAAKPRDGSTRKEAEVPAEPEKEKMEDEKLNGQVVDVAPGPDNRKPENARFLAEHNNRVEKETISRYRSKEYGVAQPRPTVAGLTRKSDMTRPEGKDEISLLMKKEGTKAAGEGDKGFAFEVPDIKKRDALQLKLDLSMGSLPTYEASQEVRGNSDHLRLRLGKPGQEGSESAGDGGTDRDTVAMLRPPSLENLAMVTGGPANDHVTDVPKGDETMLNTREFRYATFFNRIKRGVSSFWNPGDVYLRHDPYGNVYGVKDRYTILNVVLNNKGELKDVTVAESSQLTFLDEEAVRAFREASPFPNPPQGLLETDGSIRFQFGFYFEIGERPRLRGFELRRFP